MLRGIDDTSHFIILVMGKYRNKVNDPARKENCFAEFEYAQRRKGLCKFITILRDPSMSNPRDWNGLFGSCGGELNIDGVNQSVDKVCDEVVRKLSQTVCSFESFMCF